MTTQGTCLKCGAPLDGEAAQGFCSKCLFLQAGAGVFGEEAKPALEESEAGGHRAEGGGPQGDSGGVSGIEEWD